MNDEPDLEEFAPWLVLILTVAGAGLRALLLDFKGMSLDETVNIWLAAQTLPDMLHWAARINQQPPLYYMLLHGWIALKGAEPYYARLFSVLFSAGTIPFIYMIGKRLSGPMVGLAASVLLAVSPFHVFFAQDTSMYTLLTFNAVAALYALVRLLTDPCCVKPIGSQFREYRLAWRNPPPVDRELEKDFHIKPDSQPKSKLGAWIAHHTWLPIKSVETDLAWIAFILFSSATLLSHNSAFLFIVAVNLFVLGLMLVQRKKKTEAESTLQAPRLWDWTKAHIAILVLWLPWLIPTLQQAATAPQMYWIPVPTLGSVLEVLESFLNASSTIPANFARGIWVVYGLVLALGLIHFRKKLPRFLLLAVLFVVPFAIELIVSLWQPYFWAPTLIWTTIPLFLVLASGFSQLKLRPLIFLALGIFGSLNLLAASDYFKYYQKEDWNTATRDVVGHFENGDLILFSTNLGEIPFNYFFTPYEVRDHLKAEKLGIPLDLMESGVSEPVMTADDVPGLIALLDGYDRVWLVYSNDTYTDPQGLIPLTLGSKLRLVSTEYFNGGQVLFYVSP
jgi:hypothetical protein